MGKGSEFERWVCKRLSTWWEPERSDIFWRTSNSGGRATTRNKTGLSTKGQHGDICATDPIGQPLIDAITFELKRGYSQFSIMDVIDKPAGKRPLYREWMDKISRTSQIAGTLGWVLIVKRDQREPLVIASKFPLIRVVKAWPPIHFDMRIPVGEIIDPVVVMTLESFLTHASPRKIKLLRRE